MNADRIGIPLMTAFLLMMLALIGFTVYELAVPELAWFRKSIIIVSMAVTCLFMCLVIFASILLDRRHNVSAYAFMTLVFSEFLLVFSAMEHWYGLVYDMGDYWEGIVAYCNFLMFPLTVIIFAAYQVSIFDIRSRIIKGIYFVMFAGFASFVIMVVINYFTGSFPVITEDIDRFYTMTALRMGPYFFALFICILTSLLYAPSWKTKAVMIAYLMGPAITLTYSYPDMAAYACILSALLLYFIYGNTYLERGVALARNEAELSEQKVALLTSRIEPEFLIESLDSIIALEGTSPVAKRAINLFKVYFRQNMNILSEKKPIPILRELDHVKVYLSLEKLRFKEGLDVKFEITDTDFEIPAMAIQVLVENAVKHGVTQREEGGTIEIRTIEYEKSHRVQVIDDGVGFDVNAPRDPERSHIGIDNVVFRLEEMVNGTLEIRSTPGSGTIATINIPKK